MLSYRLPPRLTAIDRRYAGPAVILTVWTVVAMVAAAQAVAFVRLDQRTDLVSAILSRVSIVPLWALGTPLILRSARRFPVIDGHRAISPVSIAAHLALGSVFIVLTNVLIRLPAAVSDGGLAWLARSTVVGVAEYYPPAMVVYGVIVAIGHVLFRPNAGVGVAGVGVAAVGVAPTTGGSSCPLPAEAAAGGTRLAGAARYQPRARQNRNEPHGTEVAVLTVPASPLPRSVDDACADEAPAPASVVAAIDGGPGHIAVRQWNRVHLVRVEDIDFVEAEDNYVVVHASSKAYKGRDRISEVEAQLDARRFVRIHRSTIVHVAKIREVQPLTHGDHAVVLRDGKVLRVARSRRDALGKALGIVL